MKRYRFWSCALPLALQCALSHQPARAAGDHPQPQPWRDASQPATLRATQLVQAMTLDEKIQTVFGYFSTDLQSRQYRRPPRGRPYSAGYVPGIARLGLPPQWQSDAGIGVATQSGARQPYARTALPSGLATAATWNPALAYAGGAMIGREARLSGFNVLLAGGVNLLRDPRNGRNFEYAGEDPLLAGVMVGELVRGVQSSHVISTVKHFAFNDQETDRATINVRIADAAARMSDLLALQLAIERGNPGAVMCSYNRVNGDYACESDYLLNQVLKGDWAYPGYVMSDWGATHSTIPAARNGLDQQSGHPFDVAPYFNAGLKEAIVNGHVPAARLDDMAERVVGAMFAHGVVDHPVRVEPERAIDLHANGAVSRADAEEAIVLLKNRGGLLPLSPRLRTIAVIGGHADAGVLSGGGSSQVYPPGGSAVPNEGPAGFPGPMVYHRSSPLRELARLTKTRLRYLDGKDAKAAASLAARSDAVIVFATQWTAESLDRPSLNLPGEQDALIAALARANRRTVVVLETGGPVLMPWLADVDAVLEAWYPGTRGGEAIARVLSGAVNPSGHLPATFPAAETQLPRIAIDADPMRQGARVDTDYNIEGAAVGYKWFELKGQAPLFAFGHGLSYTSFEFSQLAAEARDGTIVVSVNVRNTGQRAGKAVAQVYVSPTAGGWEAPRRLGGWDKLALEPGAGGMARIHIDPRLLAMFDSASKTWRIAEGLYEISVGDSSAAPALRTSIHLAAAPAAGSVPASRQAPQRGLSTHGGFPDLAGCRDGSCH
ncbi:beta-glucosidase [Rugamonas apoptosis]|uniref:Glycoside hydrolase family 3 C-terminal domain-containing protein n=1 Tax=Rugamonas apoptosis TaxID=2758570 RepID=A0A7W2FBI9_9BURK|nr:glycoside hydrolase family 3 C-terminal domain-containing protein [Rugamonas apoptosis]MBA5688706.1 glycoside hydrolase family 3 C-terminal domain-containing protein [Rugamonas apoptosis]